MTTARRRNATGSVRSRAISSKSPPAHTIARVRSLGIVISGLEWIIPDDGPRLAFHARNTPIRALGGRTIMETVTAGQADKAARYLQTLFAGADGG